MKLDELPIVVIVWHMPGCGACDEYIPTFRAIADKYKACVPAFLVDASKYERAADLYRVKATPTTMILRKGHRSVMQIEGAGDEEEIERLYSYALYGRSCEIER